MYRVEVMESAHPMNDIISRANLEPTIMEHLTRASIVFVPSICDGNILAFSSGTNEFFSIVELILTVMWKSAVMMLITVKWNYVRFR